jgi:predicted GH43/DUF377 family glycosyl hydrolase
MKSIAERLLPAPINGGFRMKDYWIWCGSVIEADGKYHMFASRWSKNVDFGPYWVTNSEIVRAESDTPEGPYTFKEVVLQPRGAEYWDGKMTHNPAIRKIGDYYVLYYTGTTYEGEMPDENHKINNQSPLKIQAHKGERIGMAYSASIYGPWVREDSPIIDVVPNTWEKYLVSNPAPFVGADGKNYVMYKGVTELGTHSMGIVVADDFRGPYHRLSDKPYDVFDGCEDACVWYEDGQYHALALDHNRKYSNKEILYLSSSDIWHWKLDGTQPAISKQILFEDGKVRQRMSAERPQILLNEDGKSCFVFFATSILNEKEHYTWNMVIPLKTE